MGLLSKVCKGWVLTGWSSKLCYQCCSVPCICLPTPVIHSATILVMCVWSSCVYVQLHTSELGDGYEWGRLNLRSVTEETTLDDFLRTAQLAGTEFQAGQCWVDTLDMLTYSANSMSEGWKGTVG